MNIRDDILALHDEMKSYRREMHKNPQTAFEETYASGLIQAKLKEWGIAFEAGIAHTGVVGTIQGKSNTSGRSIGLRADIDALDIHEEPNKEWMSQNPGKMHACGHDGHTAILLGTAKYLSENPNFDGTVHLIFQPAEEGAGGADKMLDEGLFDKFPCDEIYALHNWPWMPYGQIATRPGQFLAGSSMFSMTISGVGGHAAQPEKAIDSIAIGGQIITALQSLVSRYISATNRAVVSITNFHAGTGAHNIIPDHSELIGSVRAFSQETADSLRDNLIEMSLGIGEAMGARIQIDFDTICTPTVNDEACAHYCVEAAEDVLGKDNVEGDTPAIMISEDFGSMLSQKPGAYVLVGQRRPEDKGASVNSGLHTPHYDFNDDIIPLSMEYFTRLVERRLAP